MTATETTTSSLGNFNNSWLSMVCDVKKMKLMLFTGAWTRIVMVELITTSFVLGSAKVNKENRINRATEAHFPSQLTKSSTTKNIGTAPTWETLMTATEEIRLKVHIRIHPPCEELIPQP